jgi:hypothetical protein
VSVVDVIGDEPMDLHAIAAAAGVTPHAAAVAMYEAHRRGLVVRHGRRRYYSYTRSGAPAPTGEARPVQVSLRVTPDEAAGLHAEADRRGLTMAALLRLRLGLDP